MSSGRMAGKRAAGQAAAGFLMRGAWGRGRVAVRVGELYRRCTRAAHCARLAPRSSAWERGVEGSILNCGGRLIHRLGQKFLLTNMALSI